MLYRRLQLNENEKNLKICQVTTKVIGKCLSKYVQLLREQDFQIIWFSPSFVRSFVSKYKYRI